MRIVMALTVLALAGCISAEEANRRAAMQEANDRAAYRAGVERQCDRYGFPRGTPDYAHCLMQVDQTLQSQMRDVVIQSAMQREYLRMPACSQLPPGLAGYHRAQGTCR